MRGSFAEFKKKAEQASREKFGIVLGELVAESEMVNSFNAGNELPAEMVERVGKSKGLLTMLKES